MIEHFFDVLPIPEPLFFTCFIQVAAEKEKESVSRARSMSAGMPTPSVSVHYIRNVCQPKSLVSIPLNCNRDFRA